MVEHFPKSPPPIDTPDYPAYAAGLPEHGSSPFEQIYRTLHAAGSVVGGAAVSKINTWESAVMADFEQQADAQRAEEPTTPNSANYLEAMRLLNDMGGLCRNYAEKTTEYCKTMNGQAYAAVDSDARIDNFRSTIEDLLAAVTTATDGSDAGAAKALPSVLAQIRDTYDALDRALGNRAQNILDSPLGAEPGNQVNTATGRCNRPSPASLAVAATSDSQKRGHFFTPNTERKSWPTSEETQDALNVLYAFVRNEDLPLPSPEAEAHSHGQGNASGEERSKSGEYLDNETLRELYPEEFEGPTFPPEIQNRINNLPPQDPNYQFKGSYEDGRITAKRGDDVAHLVGWFDAHDITIAVADEIIVPDSERGHGKGMAAPLLREFIRQAIEHGAQTLELDIVNPGMFSVMGKVFGEHFDKTGGTRFLQNKSGIVEEVSIETAKLYTQTIINEVERTDYDEIDESSPNRHTNISSQDPLPRKTIVRVNLYHPSVRDHLGF